MSPAFVHNVGLCTFICINWQHFTSIASPAAVITNTRGTRLVRSLQKGGSTVVFDVVVFIVKPVFVCSIWRKQNTTTESKREFVKATTTTRHWTLEPRNRWIIARQQVSQTSEQNICVKRMFSYSCVVCVSYFADNFHG